MDDIKILENIRQQKQSNIKIIISISLVTFIIYCTVLLGLLCKHNSFIFREIDFRFMFNIILAIMGILSCLLSYNSSKKDELFIMALMYIMFFMDISNARLTGYMLTSKTGYNAILTSFIRLSIVYISASSFNKLKSFIIDNKIESIMITSLISILAVYIEFNHLMPYSQYILMIYMFYNIILTIVYIYIAFKFFKMSLYKKEYIYSVIGASSLMFSIKGIYDLYYLISKKEDISLIGYSIILIGFIIFILGVFIELNQTIDINKILDEQRNLFIKIIEEHKYSNVIICDENYNIKYINKKAEESIDNYNHSYKKHLDIGDKFDIIEMFKGISNLDNIEKQLLKKGCYITNIHDKDNDDILDLVINLHTINKKKYKVISIRNNSEKYQLEKALLEYESMKKEDLMKNEFFANISHELKTPLNIIYSTNQLLDVSKDKENFKEIYDRYNSCLNINCKRMLRLIDNIVDVTKVGTGFETANFKNYDIVRVVEDMTMSVVNYANTKEIDLIFDTDVEELSIKCDLDMLERIILNLLSNAIKFSNEGSSIFVKITSDKDWVSIKIKDNGIGIDPEIQSKIFDRFVQGDKSIRRKKEGSGIGLSLVKTFVELMDGNIYLESDGKNGTEFTVLLPNKTVDSNIKEEEYYVDLQRVELELSDIYELYEHSY